MRTIPSAVPRADSPLYTTEPVLISVWSDTDNPAGSSLSAWLGCPILLDTSTASASISATATMRHFSSILITLCVPPLCLASALAQTHDPRWVFRYNGPGSGRDEAAGLACGADSH